MLLLIQLLFQLITIFVIFLLVIFNLRRLLFSFTTFFSLKKERVIDLSAEEHTNLPEVLILLPCHNEEQMVPGLSKSIRDLIYPEEKLKVVWVDDGSRDNTKSLMIKEVAEENTKFSYMSSDENIGKAAALNLALEKVSFGEIIGIFDADHRPVPDSLIKAVKYFKDLRIAGISGRTLPINPISSLSAFYSGLENDVHQMVTMRAKDRLGLAPALLGSNCYYRRAYLEACGKYRKGALLEDSDLTISFSRAGYATRFAEDVVAYHHVPETISDYLKQHTRWARGFNDVSRTHLLALFLDQNLPFLLRLELCLFSTGYLDRIAMISAAGLYAWSYLSRSFFSFPAVILFCALLVPFVQIIILYAQLRMPIGMWIRLPLIPIFYMLDIYAAVHGLTAAIFNLPRVWGKASRIRLGS